jgi:hypothetical protein
MLIAYYSTLKSLIPILSLDSAKETTENLIQTTEKQLASMIENQPQIAVEFSEFSEDNCSPWFEFYRRHQAKESLNIDLTLQSSNDSEHDSGSALMY